MDSDLNGRGSMCARFGVSDVNGAKDVIADDFAGFLTSCDIHVVKFATNEARLYVVVSDFYYVYVSTTLTLYV